MKTAILIDGGFYRKRAYSVFGELPPEERAEELYNYCMRHLKNKAFKSFQNGRDRIIYPKSDELYRVFYYDCPPVSKKVYHPYLKKTVDLSKDGVFHWTNSFFNALKCKRKVALRLGKISESQIYYTLKPNIVKKIYSGSIDVKDISKSDFMFVANQKGVDMKIGLDIASLSYKKQVDRIVLISGDSDFVSAAKLARREGIDFILDPLHANIKPDLAEHIDALKCCDKAYKQIKENQLILTCK